MSINTIGIVVDSSQHQHQNTTEQNKNMTTQNDEPPPEQQPQLQSQTPKTLTLKTPDRENVDPQQQEQLEEDQEQDDLEMLSPISQSIPNRPATTSVYTRRPNKRRKVTPQQKKRVQQEKKSMKRLELLKQELKPIPFTPIKKLDFSRHEALLKRIGLWDFVHMEFEPDIRTDLIAQLIANYCPSARGSYVNGAKIRVNRADLARALNLSVRKDKVASDGSAEVPEKESEESILFVEEIVSNWMLLHDDTWMTPSDVLNWMKLIKEGNFEKMDWASLIWFMMEKELTTPQLSHCYYASHMQCLIKNQKEGMLREEVKQEEEENGDGDVQMLDAVEDSKKAVRLLDAVEDSKKAVQLLDAVEDSKKAVQLLDAVEDSKKAVQLLDAVEDSKKAVQLLDAVEDSKKAVQLLDAVEDGKNAVQMLDAVEDRKNAELEESNIELSLGQENVGNFKEVSSLGQGNVVNLKENLSLGQENVGNLKEEASFVEEDVVNLQKNVGHGQEDVVNLQKNVGHGQENVVNLQENVSLGQENDVNLQENVGHGQENVVNLQENASLVQENVVTLQENASLLHDNVVDLQENASLVQDSVVNLQESVGKGEKELGGDDVVMNFGENKNEERGQWFLDEKNDVPDNGHFLRGCTLGDIKATDCEVEEKKEEVVEEVVEEGDEGGEEEEEEEQQQQEGGFSLSPRGENLEMVTSANLIQGMEAVQIPYPAGIQICDDDLPGEFLASRVDNNTNTIPGGSLSHFGNGNKRQIGQSNEATHQSLNGSNKRMRIASSSDFDVCLEQMEHWMGKARMLYQAKEQVCEESSGNQQLLYDELQKRDNIIEHLHKVKYEEQQKRHLEVYRLERELYVMGNILEGYRKALKETHKAFAEFRARYPHADEPLYKDVAGGGGLVLSSVEWEKQRAKQEEEERKRQEIERMKEEEERMKQEEDNRMKQEEEARMTQSLIEKNIKEFEEVWNTKFEAHMDGVHLLTKRLLDVENEVKHLKEFAAKQKVAETSECAPNE